VPVLRSRAVAAAFLLILVLVRFRGTFRFLLYCRPRGTIPVVVMPLAAVVTGTIPPIAPPLPGALPAMRDGRLRLLLGNLRWPIAGILGLRVFCHTCTTD
jgi:hypothetical protein